MRARIAVVVIALVLGFAAAFSVLKYMESLRTEAAGKKQLVEALTASSVLPIGLTLDELRSRGLIVAKRLPREFVPEGVLSPRAELKGQVLAEKVVEGEVLTTSRFAPPDRAGLSFTTPQGMVALSLPAEDERAVGNHIKVGDYVNGVISWSEDDPKKGRIKKTELMLRTVQVLAIRDIKSKPDLEEDEKKTTTVSRSDTNSTVTVAVEPGASVKVIASMEKDGKAWMTLVPSPETPLPAPTDIAKTE